MALTLEKESVIVDRVGQYGIQSGGVWYSVYEPLKPSDFLSGSHYDVLVGLSKAGKKYIKQIVNDVQPVAKTETVSTGTIVQVGEVPKKAVSGRDFDAEARGKVACAAYTAAVQSPGLLQFSSNLDELKSNVQHFAEFIIAKTFEHQRGK